MTSTVTALRPRPSADERDVLARVRELANQLAGDATDKALLFPDLCLHRFTAPTTYRKAHTFGVTLGVILEGQKRCRFGETEVTTDASRLVVVTREGLHDTAVVAATPQRPFLGPSSSLATRAWRGRSSACWARWAIRWIASCSRR